MTNFVFFGGEPLSVPTLEILYKNGFTPGLVVCNGDRPQGRKMEITPPPTKVWAQEHNVPVFQPETLRDGEAIKYLQEKKWDLFIVVAYGKIIPKEIIELPKHGTINMHPSLLPLYRGPSPIIAPILNGDMETGVTIIELDEEMDHGKILAQEKISLTGEENIRELEDKLISIGGAMLSTIIPQIISGKVTPVEQDHDTATFVKKIKKDHGEINLNDGGALNWRKYRAYFKWPGVFFWKDEKRIKVTDATFDHGTFVPLRVIPEGKKEISYEEFLRNN